MDRKSDSSKGADHGETPVDNRSTLPIQEQAPQQDSSLEDNSNIISHLSDTQEKLHIPTGSQQALSSPNQAGVGLVYKTPPMEDAHCNPSPGRKDNTPEEEFNILQPDDINFPKL